MLKKLPPILNINMFQCHRVWSYKTETTVYLRNQSICTYLYYDLLLKGSLKGD